MLIPVGLKGKERDAYVKRHTHQIRNVNAGPKPGLRPVGKKAEGAKKSAKTFRQNKRQTPTASAE